MNTEAVVEFLGNVPLLQRLPSSSLKRIAELVNFKHFEKGDYVVRGGEVGDGIYFVWEGEAEVSGSLHAEEEKGIEYQLKRYDYFGHVNLTSVHVADVIASTKLTCLFLPHEHCTLLQSKSIWSKGKTLEACAPVESILHLEPIELNIFQGITLPDAPKFGKVYGGQLVGQALAAASKTVDSLKIVHSLHSYYLKAGDFNIPIIYQVNRLRDSSVIILRSIDAIGEEGGFDHQEASMPSVPDPDGLLSVDEIGESRPTGPPHPLSNRKKVGATKIVPWPIEIKFCAPSTNPDQKKSDPSLRYWFRAKGKPSDDQALHRCVVAFASDMIATGVSLIPHPRKGSLSLCHSMWFHRHLRADDWLLLEIVSPTACDSRCFLSGQIFNRKGELVVSLTQEVLLKMATPPNPSADSKL
ncbi:hypothetical protein GQ457_04G031610 [Hibiscus cannabinus]